MMDFEGLVEFHYVATHRSISGAAKALGIPRATVSRRITALEERLGTRLAHRTTRRLNLTAAGEALFARTHSLLADLEAATTAVQRLDDVPRGLLRVSAPPLQRQATFSTFVIHFLQQYPEVEIELLSDARFVDLREERVDVAIRASHDDDPSLIRRKLQTSNLLAVASPEYAATHGLPSDLDALADHPCLLGFDKGHTPQTHWPTRHGPPVQVSGPLRSNNIEVLVDGVRAGLGIAMLPDLAIADDLESSQLIPVLPNQLGTRGTLSVVYVERKLQDPKVRAFIDQLVAWLARHPLVFRESR